MLRDSTQIAPALAWLGRLRHHHEASASHSIRVARILMAMWVHAPEVMGAPEVLLIGGALHDIGKLAVPASILASDRRLNAEEQALVRRHPDAGAEILRGLDFAPEVVSAARHHHEHWQGGGYPSGLPSARLHPVARAVAVADAFVAMVEPGRAYRRAMTAETALGEIAACRGTQFDPQAADILIASLAQPAFGAGAAIDVLGQGLVTRLHDIREGLGDA
ncbi:HD-GYP domain-containing protein [Roseomonas sp. F4]